MISPNRHGSSSKSNKPSTPNSRRRERERRSHKRCEVYVTHIRITPTYLHSAQSTITNKSRLQLLHKREEVLQRIFAAVREPTTPFHQQSGQYDQFLEGVIAESALYVSEPSIIIYSRKSEVERVEQAAANAAKTYQELSGKELSFTVEGTIPDDLQVSITFPLEYVLTAG